MYVGECRIITHDIFWDGERCSYCHPFTKLDELIRIIKEKSTDVINMVARKLKIYTRLLIQ